MQGLRLPHDQNSSWSIIGGSTTGLKAAPSTLVEQPGAELVFERQDLSAERRLRHVQPLGAAAEIVDLGEGTK